MNDERRLGAFDRGGVGELWSTATTDDVIGLSSPANEGASASPSLRPALPSRPTRIRRWLRSGEVPLALRLLEIAVALAALICSLPLMLAIAVAIRRDSPGSALFVQKRLGKDQSEFNFVKFRTLHTDAKMRWPELYAYSYTPQELAELKFKVENDPRVTAVGRWLRRTSLDELPNFWNVLTGDIALVGPRPEIPEMLPYYTHEMRRKFSVRPGVTGLAQVLGRGRLSFHDTVRLDLEYVDKRSFWYDVKILFRTLRMVIIGDGAF